MQKLDKYYKNHTVQQVREDLFNKLCYALIVLGGVMAVSFVLKNDITHAEDIESYQPPLEEKVIAENLQKGTIAKSENPKMDLPKDENLENKKPTTWRRLNKNGYSQRYIHLTAEGRQDRIIELIGHYGFTIDDWYAIRTIARIHHIQPEMIVCIAYADSSMGKFLKTEHNYGNVGNNDRGDTQSYKNFEQGMNAIAKTLNGTYLKGYSEVWQLAGSSNPSGPNYATELTRGIRSNNRFNNVLNCLGMVHNKEIAPGYNYKF